MTGLGKHANYVGIDPGHYGAIALLSASGAYARVWKMPWKDGEYDLAGLHEVFKHLKMLPDCAIGVEWPVAWPGSFANVVRDAENFGRGKAYLEAFAFLMGFPYARISPQAWKGRLHLPGKTHEGAEARAVEKLDGLLPQHSHLIRGPRGGILSGPLDALLIAEALRSEILDYKYSTFLELGKSLRKLTRPKA